VRQHAPAGEGPPPVRASGGRIWRGRSWRPLRVVGWW
jgi:hypothetical protein